VAVAQLGLVKILVLRQDYEEAETNLEKLISEQPRSALLSEMFQNLFEIYSKEGNPTPELAQWAAESAQNVGPDRPALALFHLARLQLGQGLKIEAEQTLQQLVERFPNHQITVEGSLALSRLLAESGRLDEAAKQLEAVLERDPSLPISEQYRINYQLGEVLHQKGDVSAARDIFRDLSRNFQLQRENTLFNWAICSLELGDGTGFEEAFHAL